MNPPSVEVGLDESTTEVPASKAGLATQMMKISVGRMTGPSWLAIADKTGFRSQYSGLPAIASEELAHRDGYDIGVKVLLVSHRRCKMAQ